VDDHQATSISMIVNFEASTDDEHYFGGFSVNDEFSSDEVCVAWITLT